MLNHDLRKNIFKLFFSKFESSKFKHLPLKSRKSSSIFFKLLSCLATKASADSASVVLPRVPY